MPFDPYNIMHDAAVGAAIGGGGQFAYNSYKKNKDTFPILGTVAGAGAGALTGMYLNKYKARQEHTPVLQKLRPGLYYMERGIWGDSSLLKGTDFHKYARHGFFVGVYDEKPSGIETNRLPNGQYVVTFGGFPKNNDIGLPEDLYVAINGKNTVAGIDSPSDLRTIKSLFDSDFQKLTDYEASIHPIDLNPETSKKTIAKLYDTTRKLEGTSLGKYSLSGNNCLSASAELARAAGIDTDKLPPYLGGIGGLYSKDIPQIPDHLNNKKLYKDDNVLNFDWLKAGEFKPAFTQKSKKCAAAKYILSCRTVKKAGDWDTFKKNWNLTFGPPDKHYTRQTEPLKRITPGLYYSERGVYGKDPFASLLSNTAFNQQIRHGYLSYISDEQPEKLESIKLPNGQYLTSFAGFLSKDGLTTKGKLYLAANGLSQPGGVENYDDYDAIKALVDPNYADKTDFKTYLKPIEKDKEKSLILAKKLYDIVKKYEGKTLGKYVAGAIPSIPPNNCLNSVGLLARLAEIDRSQLPEHIGMMGGYDTKDLDKHTQKVYDKLTKEKS